MYRLMQPSDWAEVLALWQAQRGDTEEFVRGAVERFAGVHRPGKANVPASRSCWLGAQGAANIVGGKPPRMALLLRRAVPLRANGKKYMPHRLFFSLVFSYGSVHISMRPPTGVLGGSLFAMECH